MKSPPFSIRTQLVLGLWCALCAGPNTPAAELTQSFRGRGYDTHYFRATGSNSNRALRADLRGLRINLSNANSRLPVGLVTHFGVRGDFEITLDYELLRLPKPEGGNGAGVSIYINSATLTQEAATLGQFISPSGEQNFVCHHATTPLGEERRHEGYRSPAKLQSGQLRLVRTGKVLSYQVAEGGRSDFQELYQTEWASEDVQAVRFAADNGGWPANVVDVFIRSIRIQGEEFGAARQPPQPFRWTLGMTMSLIILFLATGSLWFWRRWRRIYLGR